MSTALTKAKIATKKHKITKKTEKNTALSPRKQATMRVKTKMQLGGNGVSVRGLAAQIILQVLDQGKSLSALLPQVQTQVKEQDSALLQELCFGICRVLPRLERILALLLDRPLKGKTRIVHCLLLVGLYQLLYTRIPQHAAVDEVVSGAKALQVDSFRGLLNAVLRRFLREQEDILAKVDKHWQTLHPEWLVNFLKQTYPNWRDIVEANNQKPPMWLRVNQQKYHTAEYQTLLTEQAIATELGVQPECALHLLKAVAVNQLPYFQQGDVSVQDKNAQWAALLLQPQNQQVILDACAAPGGKTVHLLELAPQANVIALDIEEGRLARVKENLHRAGQTASVVCGDASDVQSWIDQVEIKEIEGQSAGLFDKILLDAPCSATGVIRRHPDIKWLRQEEDIAQLATLQAKILYELWQYLKPNGELLYATCSVLAQENSQQIEAFLQKTADAELVDLSPLLAGTEAENTQYGWQFLPSQQGGDGFFYAKLQKKAREQ